jgi:hypothetical protein
MLTRLVMREVRRALLYIRAFVSTNNHNNTSKDEATYSRSSEELLMAQHFDLARWMLGQLGGE